MMDNKTKRFFLVGLLCCLIPFCLIGQQSTDTKIGDADQAFLEKNYNLAVKICRAEIKQGVATQYTYEYLSLSLYQLNYFQSVVNNYYAASKAHRLNSVVKHTYLLALFRLGQSAKAVKEGTLLLDPEVNRYRYQVILLYYQVGEYYLSTNKTHLAVAQISEALIHRRQVGLYWQKKILSLYLQAIDKASMESEANLFLSSIKNSQGYPEFKKAIEEALVVLEKQKRQKAIPKREQSKDEDGKLSIENGVGSSSQNKNNKRFLLLSQSKGLVKDEYSLLYTRV